MGFLDPDGMDVFRRGEPSVSLLGTQPTDGMDVFRRGEPAQSLLMEEPAPPSNEILVPHLMMRGRNSR